MNDIELISKEIPCPYKDVDGKDLYLGCMVNKENINGYQDNYQIRIRHGKWVVYPVGALCYMELDQFIIENNRLRGIKKYENTTILVPSGFAMQNLIIGELPEGLILPE